MTAKDLELELYNNDIIFTFSGSISYNTLTAISISIKEELSNREGTSKELFNAYYVFIELIQNIMNYSIKRTDESDNGSGTCFVIHHNHSKKFKICAGNLVSSEQVSKIKVKIDKINSLDEQGLKDYYKEIRRSGQDTHNKGGGLGFIEIARKSSEKLNYKITEIDSDKFYFELNVDI
ncbi:MAG: SiaB family protein kinase [Campylobacterota bacterium]|nr:SiaB family protein kinase [Campylobacterota bacterium]